MAASRGPLKNEHFCAGLATVWAMYHVNQAYEESTSSYPMRANHELTRAWREHRARIDAISRTIETGSRKYFADKLLSCTWTEEGWLDRMGIGNRTWLQSADKRRQHVGLKPYKNLI